IGGVLEVLDDGVAAAAGPADGAAHLGDGGGAGRELEDRAALEVDAEVQPEDDQGDDADRQDHPGDGVPEPLAAHELDRDLAAVELAADVAQRRHHASFAGVCRAGTGAAVRRGVPRQGARAPSREGSRPDSGCPPPKNLVRASSVIIGGVKVNPTTTSMIVVRPRVNAKPRTLPIAK